MPVIITSTGGTRTLPAENCLSFVYCFVLPPFAFSHSFCEILVLMKHTLGCLATLRAWKCQLKEFFLKH